MTYKQSFLFISIIFLLGIFFQGCDNNSGVSDPTGPPEVVSVNPSDNEDNVSVTTSVTAQFNQPMNESSIDESTFTLRQDTTTISGRVTTTDTTATLSFRSNLEYSTTYTARLSSEITDAKDKALPNEREWNFTTEPAPDDGDEEENDTTPPSVNSTFPVDGAAEVSVNENISATFSEPLDASTVTEESFLVEQDGTPVEGAISYSENTATFNPSENLSYNTTFTFTLSTTITDTAGNALEEEFAGSFTTEEQEEDGDDNGENNDTDPPAIASVEPSDGTDNVSIETNITVEFSEEMIPSSLNDNTFYLQQGGNQVEGSIDHSGATATFNPASALAYNQPYTLTVTTGAEDLAGNGLAETSITGFTTEPEPDTEPPTVTTTTPDDGATSISTETEITVNFSEDMDANTLNNSTITLSGPNGEVNGNASPSGSSVTFIPTGTLEFSSEYRLSISTEATDLAGNNLQVNNPVLTFTTAEAPDTEAPTVQSSTPEDGATDVAPQTDVTASFSEAMDSGTLNGNSVTLQHENGTNVPGTVDASGSSVTFIPDSDLEFDTQYSFTISTAAADPAGNTLQAPYTATFTTDPGDTNPPIVTDYSYGGTQNSVLVDTEFMITFNEAMDESSLNTTSIYIEDVEGNRVPGEVEVPNNSNNPDFIPNEPLEYNTQYTLVVTGDATDPNGNSVQNAPVTFTFTTEPAPDNQPPEVTSTTPNNGSTGVARDTEVSATFNETMDATTINANTVTLEGPGGLVTGSVSTTSSDTQVVFNPADSLQADAEYSLHLNSEITDAAGNSLVVANPVASFTTEAAASGDDGMPDGGGEE